MVTGKIKPTRASSGLHTLKHSATNSAEVFIIQDAKRIAILYGIVLYCYSGASNTLEHAVATPTDSGVLSCPGFIKPLVSNEGLCSISLWARCAYPKGRRHSVFYVTNTPAHPMPLVRQKGGYRSQHGDMNHD